MCEVPAGVRTIVVRLDSICNQPAVKAAGDVDKDVERLVRR